MKEPPSRNKDLFCQSLDRCLSNDGFIPAFYKRFLQSSEEIRHRFRFTNFDKQNRMLSQSLKLISLATTGDPAGLTELRERAKTHDRDHLAIRPELYDMWLEAVVATAEDFDEQWQPATEEAWRHILGFGIDYMVRRY